MQVSAAKWTCLAEFADDILPRVVGAIKVGTMTKTDMVKPMITPLLEGCHRQTLYPTMKT
jgi:hypothetical protein